MTVGGLAAHLYRATLTVRLYLDGPVAGDRPPVSAAEYYDRLLDPRWESETNAAIRRRGEEGAAVGPDGLIASFDDTASWLAERVPAEEPHRIVTVAGGLDMTLDDYLRTRILEIAVHADDLAASLGTEAHLPAAVWGEAIAMLADLARRRHGDVAVLRALARRERTSGTIFPVL
jgi:hypothetical protein